jgi:uncharacterized protein
MPPTVKHYATSAARTGKDYAEVHNWIDAEDVAKKYERHSFTNIWKFGPEIAARYGEEGVAEYIEHLREDIENKISKLVPEHKETLKEAFIYFGFTRQDHDPAIAEADIAILRKAGMNATDLAHSIKVAEKSLEIARRIVSRSKAQVDMELVARGALFHDLGKVKTHAMEHGKIGAEMGAALGLPASITAIMEKHIRGGLTAAEAVELGLPVKDYTLHALEERIVIYADRLVDIITDGIVAIASEQDAEDRFVAILQDNIKYGKNAVTIARYIGYDAEIQGLMRA